jgi:hypothetical protein
MLHLLVSQCEERKPEASAQLAMQLIGQEAGSPGSMHMHEWLLWQRTASGAN